MCVCVRVHARACACMCVYACACMHACVRACVHACVVCMQWLFADLSEESVGGGNGINRGQIVTPVKRLGKTCSDQMSQ